MTITPSSQHVEVRIGGETVATSDRPVLLEETGMPTRYYLPREDVTLDKFRRTTFESTCPLKGQASYWSYESPDTVLDGVLWSYEDPIPQAEGITDLVSFYNDRVELLVDGEAA